MKTYPLESLHMNDRSIKSSMNDFSPLNSPMDDDSEIPTPKSKMIRNYSPGKNQNCMDNNDSQKYQFYKIYSGFLEKFGSDAAVIIAIFASYQQYRNRLKLVEDDNWFYYEHPKLKQHTHISIHRQHIAMRKLKELGILQIAPEKKGIPPKTFYRVNIDTYNRMIESLDNGRKSNKYLPFKQ